MPAGLESERGNENRCCSQLFRELFTALTVDRRPGGLLGWSALAGGCGVIGERGQGPAPAGQFPGDGHVGDGQLLLPGAVNVPPGVQTAIARLAPCLVAGPASSHRAVIVRPGVRYGLA